MRGTIVRLLKEKNIGFISVPGEGAERFFHRGSVSFESTTPFQDLEEGDVVDFEPEISAKGPRAQDKSLTYAHKEGE